MDSRRSTLVAALLVLLPGVVVADGATRTRVDYGFTLAAGHDSNPLLVSGDGPNGWFSELRADGALSRELGTRFELFGTARAEQRFHESRSSDADTTSGRLRLGLAVSPVRPLSLAAGGIYGLRRTTYTDRADGRPYEIAAAPAIDPGGMLSVSIADRFDSDTTGVFLDTRWKVGRRVRLSLESERFETSYREDYAAQTTLDSLDSTATRIEPGVRVIVNAAMTIWASVAWIATEYDEYAALDDSGLAVAGVPREYRSTSLRFTMQYRPTERWKFGFGLFGGDRSDTFAGYYDSESVSSYVSMDRDFARRGAVRLLASLRSHDYENATVVGGPDAETRGSDEARYLGRYTIEVAPRLRWYAEGGVQRADSRDPVFSYDREWLVTGIQFRR